MAIITPPSASAGGHHGMRTSYVYVVCVVYVVCPTQMTTPGCNSGATGRYQHTGRSSTLLQHEALEVPEGRPAAEEGRLLAPSLWGASTAAWISVHPQ